MSTDGNRSLQSILKTNNSKQHSVNQAQQKDLTIEMVSQEHSELGGQTSSKMITGTTDSVTVPSKITEDKNSLPEQ